MRKRLTDLALLLAVIWLAGACSQQVTIHGKGRDPDPHPEMRRMVSLVDNDLPTPVYISKYTPEYRKNSYQLHTPVFYDADEEDDGDIIWASKEKSGWFTGLRLHWEF